MSLITFQEAFTLMLGGGLIAGLSYYLGTLDRKGRKQND